MANYIGKIAAVGTINMSQIASGLNASARDVEKYARTVRSTIVSANSAAGRSFQEIFTPLQRLERALQAANTRTLDIKVGGTAERIRAIVGAANDIARPLTASQKQFTALSATIQNEFIGSLTRAQNAAQLAENAINRGQIKNAAGYERLKQVVDRFTESQRRLSEVSSSVGGLATGRELRFQQAGFAAELQRTSALQSQASALPADARASGALGQLVELQRREAEEAARLLAVLENVRNTRQGDAAAAQANLDAQVRRLGEVNAQLERQVSLSDQATRAFTLSQAARQPRGLGLFGSQVGTEEERAIDRARRVSAEFARLPQAAQAGLGGLAGIVSRVADGVAAGTSNAQQLNAVLDRLSSQLQQVSNARALAEAETAPIIARARAEQEFYELSQRLRQQAAADARALAEAETAPIIARARAEQEFYELSQRLRQQAAADARALAEAETAPIIARARAEQEFEEESQRLRRQAAADAMALAEEEAAQLIARARAERDFAELSERLRRQAAEDTRALAAEDEADQQRRREVATALLPPVIDLPPDPRQASLERTQALADRLGPDIASSATALAQLESSTVSLKNQISQLPAPFRAQLIPAIRQAENELLRLTAADDALPEDIERAAANLRNLETGIGRAARAAQQFGGTFREFADASDSRAAAGGLEFLRNTLLRATGDTRAAEAAIDRYSAALQRAANVPGGFRRLAGELAGIRQQAVAAVAATEGVGLSARRINEGIRRTGDVARGSFGNTGLAIQQAAFIVDDFFSVTGGIEQRIRAIGNNISQLGFIVGGTYGLIVGVAVSVGAQAASALIKWANAGRSTENQTRALNEILQRQKTVVEELATAFNALGQQIVSRGFSPAASAANELADRLKEIVRLQREAAESALTATSQGVAERRADQDVIRQRLESETNVGRRAALQRQLIEAQQSERETAARTRASASSSLRLPRGILNQDFAGSVRPVAGNQPTGEEVAALLRRISDEARQRANSRQGINRSIDDLSGSTRPEFLAASQQLQQFARDLNLGSTADAIESQAASLQQAIELFKGAAARTLAGFNTDAANEASEFIRVITEVRSRILDEFNTAINQTINQTFQETDRASRIFADAQRAAQEAIERGVVGSEEIASGLDAAQEAIKRSVTAINEVLAGVDSRGRPVERTPEQIRGIVNREQANIRQLQPQLLRAAEQTLQSRLGRVVGGERATAALQSLQGAESFANEYAGLTAQLQRAVELERIARERVARSSDAQSLAALAAARSASDLAASVTEAALAIDADFSRLRQDIDATLQVSQQAADDAQRRVSESGGFGGRPIADLERERDRAQANFLGDRSRLGQLRDQLAVDRSVALQSPEVQRINQRLEAIRNQREAAAERARITGQPEDIRTAARLSSEQTRLENDRAQAVDRLTAATRRAIEAENQAITQRERQAAFLRTIQEQLFPTGDPVQGLDALRTPAERVGVQLQKIFADIDSAVAGLQGSVDPRVLEQRRARASRRAIEDVTELGLSDRQKFARGLENSLGSVQAAAQRFLRIGDRQAAIDFVNTSQNNLARQNAPLFAQFSDEVANAVLQGPSRAALQVSDASTSEGQRELNRLLRGDDSARDVNLVELQKQSDYLQSIDSGISALKDRLGIAQ